MIFSSYLFVSASLATYVLAVISSLATKHSLSPESPRFITQLKSHLVVVFTVIAFISLMILTLTTLIGLKRLVSWELLLCIMLSGFGLISQMRLNLKFDLLALNVVCVWLVGSYLMSVADLEAAESVNILRDIHIICATLGQGTAIIAMISAGFLLFKQKELKTKTALNHSSFPSLNTLKQMFDLSCLAGLISFSCALISGVLFVSAQPHSSEFTWIKLSWALCIWLYYLYLMGLRSYGRTPLMSRVHQTLWGLGGHLCAYMVLM